MLELSDENLKKVINRFGPIKSQFRKLRKDEAKKELAKAKILKAVSTLRPAFAN